MKSYTKKDLGGADLMMYVGVHDKRSITGGGVAYRGVVCEKNDELKLSLVFYSISHGMMAETMAHEVGHNLGMKHGFHKDHGGTGKVILYKSYGELKTYSKRN